MNISNPLFVVISLIIVLLTLRLFPQNFVSEVKTSRFNSIDGLRGYLAFFVFLHHSIIWYFYITEGVWQVPPTRLFRHFGQASVAMFFMITSFLFFSKLINSRSRKIDWHRIFVSRILRLVPLYLFAMVTLVFLVFATTGFQVNESWSVFFINFFKWLAFTIPGEPNLNGVVGTNLIIAGVTWSLPYEWFFYFSLPVLALILGNKESKIYLVLSVLSLYAFYKFNPAWYHLYAFGAGMVAALLVRIEKVKKILEQKIGSYIFIIAVAAVLFGFSSSYSEKPLTLLMIAFLVIASGNSVFGVFTNKYSRMLGEMAYSIYLLHGLLLYGIFKFILGFEIVKSMSVYEFWGTIILTTPVLLGVTFLTFTYIEKYSMEKVDRVMDMLIKKN